MHFSVIMPAPGHEREAVHERLSGPYAEHQWLWRLFPAPSGSPRDFLFRRRDVEGMPRYYIVSKRLPQSASTAWRIQSRDYAPKIERGMRLRFDLRANPVVTHGRTGKSARHDVVMEEKKRLLDERGLARWADWHTADKPALPLLVREACGQWLCSRAERLGFEVDEAALMVEGYQQYNEDGGRLRISTVDFSGELKVTDASRFGASLYEGVGRAKAFGCGLLLVRRPD